MMKKTLPFFLSALFLMISIVCVSYDRRSVPAFQATDGAVTADAEPVLPDEMRGVWVTYMTLDVENETDKEAAFKQKADRIVSDTLNAGLNTMIVQVRPFSDAIYPSRYYPWSHILTGEQGKDPGYDPLRYLLDRAHESGIAVHAWINPYRVATAETPGELCRANPYQKDSSIGAEINGGIYLNPASQKARELIVNGVRELAEQYDIDGIQFDDYFYPPDCGDFDAEDYEAYTKETSSPLSLEDFRKENVNQLIAQTYRAVHDTDPTLAFGISPQGNLKNNQELYADVVKWCEEEGYADYICPQIYFSLDNPSLTFEDGLADWLALDRHKKLKLYVGLPAYKAGTDADSGTWTDNHDILRTEIKIIQDLELDGFLLYSYDSFHNDDNKEEIENVIRYLSTSPTQ